MEIPSVLEAQIREGKVVLVLGAGASLDSTNAKGDHPPTGTQLAAMLSDKFLGGKHREEPLSVVSEYAISETDLLTVQGFLRDIFEDFEPAPAHIDMAGLCWYGMVTTNYDRVIEKAYDQQAKPLQKACPFIENGDRVEDALRDPAAIMLLKLHGCITRIGNEACPLILTPDQYVEYRKGRNRIFDHLKSWAYERPIIFIGQSLNDADLRALLLELNTLGQNRPRYYIVSPDMDPIRQRFWETKKITPLAGSFADFINAVRARIGTPFQALSLETRNLKLPIAEHFQSNVHLSNATLQFLESDVEYVKGITSTDALTPKHFYRGFNPGFAAIEQNLDIRRNLGDTILLDNFLSTEADHHNRMELILVKAHAGAGKTVLLRRMAWDAANDYHCLCLFLRPNGVVNAAALQELISVCNRRIFLFVDDAADHARELQTLAKNIKTEGRLLTVIVAERLNEWNVGCDAIAPLVTDEYELRYLSEKELDALLMQLEKHRALGTLEPLLLPQRRAALAEHAGRQLLVALHEATLAKPFEDIIDNEFRNIVPFEAQRIYLTICVLNRLNVPVRAGIVARIHGIPFEEFKQRFFGPLEQVVTAEYDSLLRDWTYRARHPHIAEIVFERVLRNQEERFDVYLKCLRELNIDYSTDRRAFREMVRGRVLLELFPNHELVRQLYATVEQLAPNDPFLLHQMGLYEMHRPNGNYREAENLLTKAGQLAPNDLTVKHSMAEMQLKAAECARTPLERDKLLRQASAISRELIGSGSDHSYGHHTLVKIALRRLKDILDDATDAQQPAIEDAIKEIERHLYEGLQQSPGDAYLLETEAQLAVLLSDSQRAVRALEKAFEINPRSTFVAIRLAQHYRTHGESAKGETLLRAALESNRGERRLHYVYAKILLDLGQADGSTLLYHLQRAFTPGDTNYDAQLLYGRQLFLNGELDQSRDFFRKLANATIPFEVRHKQLYALPQMMLGQVIRCEAAYAFLQRHGAGDWIYLHRSNTEEGLWQDLQVGVRLSFRIAFSLRGPCALDIKLEGQRTLLPKA